MIHIALSNLREEYPRSRSLRGYPHLVIGYQCLGAGTKWCCVHTLSARYMTVSIVTPFRPVRRHFETWAYQREQSCGLPGTNKNCVHTETQCPVMYPSTRLRPCRPCTRAPVLWPNSSVGTWHKGVFTLVPSEYRTRATCANTKYERSGCLLNCHC